MEYIARNPINGNCVQLLVAEGSVNYMQLVRPSKTNLFFTPGFCDLQVNGGFGIDLNAKALTVEQVSRLNQELLRNGVTCWCPTIITGEVELMCHNLETVATACREDPLVQQCVIGIHLEGPFISPIDGARGAHPREFIQAPDLGLFRRFQAAARGRIRLVTLAPELDGAMEMVETLTGQGILVAVGHSLANNEQLDSAVQAGTELATHLGNGLPAQLDRHQNPFLHMLLMDDLWASVILDGHHLPRDVRELLRRTKGVERMVMVSDATRLVGMEPGVYDEPIGGAVELSGNGRLSLAGTAYLAGAAMTLFEDANAMLRTEEFSLKEIIKMAMVHPRELMSVEQNSIVLLQQDPKTKQLKIIMTAIDNQIVYSKEEEDE